MTYNRSTDHIGRRSLTPVIAGVAGMLVLIVLIVSAPFGREMVAEASRPDPLQGQLAAPSEDAVASQAILFVLEGIGQDCLVRRAFEL